MERDTRQMTERRKFLATLSGTLAAAATSAACRREPVDAPNVIAQPKVQWRMSTVWTMKLQIHQGTAQRLAKVVDETSGDRFKIEVFPGDQIIPSFECFEAASQALVGPVGPRGRGFRYGRPSAFGV